MHARDPSVCAPSYVLNFTQVTIVKQNPSEIPSLCRHIITSAELDDDCKRLIDALMEPSQRVQRIFSLTCSWLGADMPDAAIDAISRLLDQLHLAGLLTTGVGVIETGGQRGRKHMQIMADATIIPDRSRAQDLIQALCKEHAPGMPPPPPKGFHVYLKLHIPDGDTITLNSMLGCVLCLCALATCNL